MAKSLKSWSARKDRGANTGSLQERPMMHAPRNSLTHTSTIFPRTSYGLSLRRKKIVRGWWHLGENWMDGIFERYVPYARSPRETTDACSPARTNMISPPQHLRKLFHIKKNERLHKIRSNIAQEVEVSDASHPPTESGLSWSHRDLGTWPISWLHRRVLKRPPRN